MSQLDTLIKEVALETVREEMSGLKNAISQLPDLIVDRMKLSYAPDDILNTVQVAEYLGYSSQTITNWRNKGINLTYHLQDEKVRYLFADVKAFKDSMLGKKITPRR
ncbi:MAG: helix-turn-helix domain-containing protein [Deferribacteraceae bacterium]|nr:helix-turn-helix domain-containing protein [Deferribacteraceae bacterium]